MFYALDFCVIVQSVWPLDATFIFFIFSIFNSKKPEKQEELKLGQISKYFREKNVANIKDSIILIRKSENSDSEVKKLRFLSKIYNLGWGST